MEGRMGQRAKMSSGEARRCMDYAVAGSPALMGNRAFDEARSILAETEPSIDYATFYVPINGGCYVADDEMQSALAESLAAFVEAN
jgi:hypothetical protein